MGLRSELVANQRQTWTGCVGLCPASTPQTRCNSESRALSVHHPALSRPAMSPDTRPFRKPLATPDTPPSAPSRSLEDFRRAEGRESRKRHLLALWDRFPPPQPRPGHPDTGQRRPLGPDGLTYEGAETLQAMYDDELLVLCKGSKDRVRAQGVSWEEFKKYAEAKEVGRLFCITLGSF